MYHIACVESIPEFPPQLGRLGHDFLSVCLQRKPNKRPDVTSLLLHPFVAFFDEPSYIAGDDYRPDSAMQYMRPTTAAGYHRDGYHRDLPSRERVMPARAMSRSKRSTSSRRGSGIVDSIDSSISGPRPDVSLNFASGQLQFTLDASAASGTL